MKSALKILLLAAALFSAGFLVVSLLPKDETSSGRGGLRIGAGDDISGYLMEKTLARCQDRTVEEKAAVEAFEFNDC